MHRFCGTLILVWLAIASLGGDLATGAETATALQADVAAVRTAAKNYLAAVRSGDVDAMRRTWTPEGDYIDASGKHFKAHELIHQRSAAATSGADSKTASTVAPASNSALRFITPDVAIEDGSSELGMAEDGSTITGRFTAVWVKRGGLWLLDSLREAVTRSSSTNDQLQQLSWLLGEWAGAADDHAIVVSSDWSENGNYIVREFAVHGSGDKVVTGTERIGWDPVRGEIVSWTFDSQGGRSEGRWKRDGERWLVENSKVMPDGKTATTTAVYAPAEDGTFTWEVNSASIAGEQLPPVRIEFKRAAEDE